MADVTRISAYWSERNERCRLSTAKLRRRPVPILGRNSVVLISDCRASLRAYKLIVTCRLGENTVLRVKWFRRPPWAARVINPPVSMPTGESRLVTTFATINGEILRKGWHIPRTVSDPALYSATSIRYLRSTDVSNVVELSCHPPTVAA